MQLIVDREGTELWEDVINQQDYYVHFAARRQESITKLGGDDGYGSFPVNHGDHNKFIPFPKCSGLCYFNPPSPKEKKDDQSLSEFVSILESLPSLIQKYIPLKKMHKIYDSHCVETPDETRRSLVIIDGGRFEFYIPTSEENSMTSSFMFDTHIMGPLMSKWLMPKLTYLKTPTDFKDQLLKYIARCYDQSYQIHAISFILDYPKSSAVRQWSHIDGYKNMYQGSISCGNGSSVTLEFCCLDTKVTTPSDLQHVWKFLPKTNGVISAIHGNSFCTHLIRQSS